MTVSNSIGRSLFDFRQLEQSLADWPQNARNLSDVTGFKDGIYNRIHQILLQASDLQRLPNFNDLLPLIRQVVLERLYGSGVAKLKVNLGKGWPEREIWESFGFRCQDAVDHRVVTPTAWHPDWLPFPWGERTDENDHVDIFSDCFKKTAVRADATIPIDPFVGELTDYDTYVCPGQKEAVLSALLMPEGSTLIVNLPTGAGKTLVAQIPVLMNGLDRGLSIFVVPTTALAIDQARRMQQLLLRRTHAEVPPLAWHGELDEHKKETIKSNIRQGKQGIIFASPEAVTGALLPSIYIAAKSGLLRYLIVDEAHLIAQWGDSFRPAFQTIAGLRRGLLESAQGSAFRTILMSATFSPESVETLDKLFGPPEKVQMVSAVHLRPEPRYWAVAAENEEQKQAWVLDLLRHAPRPFIMYVTRREDANKWKCVLARGLDNVRIAKFTGETANLTREQVIQDWAENNLDGVIATSAFGVGIDKSDVRTVIHATVPESLDRFYQEVGRGGRDGYACLSVTIYSPRDISIAEGMSTGGRLSKENAFSRWTAMFTRGEQLGDLRNVDLQTVPPNLQQQTDFNQSWNMRTLILMARAGLVQLASTPPETLGRLEQEDDAAFEQRIENHWTEYYAKIPIRTLDGQHLDQNYFNEIIGAEQSRNREAANKSLDLLLRALSGDMGMGEAIAQLYTSRTPGREIIVSRVCRGCPALGRTKAAEELAYNIPIGVGIHHIAEQRTTDLGEDFSENSHALVIYYPEGTDRITKELEQALRSLVENYGVCEVFASTKFWDSETSLKGLHKHVPRNFIVRRDLESKDDRGSILPLPRVTVLLPWGQEPIPYDVEYSERPINVILAPINIRSVYDHKSYVEISTNCVSLRKFIERSTI
ncbi:MAG: hypothetical protein CMM54_02385 [Rhodospirillaceae bacterium]|nr:hypothetical protein [Rhodospirillaceae bacterium]|tara:strand:+ start:2068 stop:4698 length:2631 start_codon:yes stop_codon:yes gene_type:complete